MGQRLGISAERNRLNEPCLSIFIGTDETPVENEFFMVIPEKDWCWEARVLLRRELQAAGIGYAELAAALALQGLSLTPKVLSNKINRGTFTMAFFMQCMAICKVNQIKLN